MTGSQRVFKLLTRTTYRYIRALHAYLVSFTKRSQPLVDVETQQREAEEQFTKSWESGELVEEWQDSRQSKAPTTENGEAGIWCAACTYAKYFSVNAR